MIDKIICFAIAFYPIIRTLFDKSSGHLFELLVVCLFIRTLIRPSITKLITMVSILILMSYQYMSSFYVTDELIYFNNIKFATFIFMFLNVIDNSFLSNLKSFFDKYKTSIYSSALISILIQYWTIFVKGSMVVKNGVIEIKGTTVSSHMLGYVLYSVIVISIYYCFRNKDLKYKLLLFLTLGLVVLLDARTIMGSILLISSSLVFTLSKKQILAVGMIFLILYPFTMKYISNLPLFEKNEVSSETSSFTSGRDVFWEIDLNYFKKGSAKEKLLGRGVLTTVFINEYEYKMAIWAHNDFIEILVSRGILTLIIYIFLFLRYIRKSIYKNGIIITFQILISSMMLMVFNGYYEYLIPTLYSGLLLITKDKGEKNG